MSRQLMGFREYARYRDARGLAGVTLRAVQKAIEAGRITTVQDERGKTKIDPEVADIQWGRNTDPDQSARANAGRERSSIPPSGESPAAGRESGDQGLYWDARTRREITEAAKAALQLEEMSGNLVNKEQVERAAYETGRMLRDMMLSIPGKIADSLAAESDPRAIEIRIREELRKVLDEIARIARDGLAARIS